MYIRSLMDCEYGKWKRPEWQEFERLVRDCAAVEFGQEFHLFGRSGQKDYGIDVFSDDWKTVIQCKDYKDYGKLRGKIQEDFQEARSHFVNEEDGKPFIETYIVATTLETDGATQELARDLSGNGIQVEVWFWEDICRIINSHRIRNDADDFIKGFREPLFLHRNRKEVSLENLFVQQDYQELGEFKFLDSTRRSLEDRLRHFFHQRKKLLIIEGDAGSGKSSLVAWICHETEKDSRKETLTGQVSDPRRIFQTPPLLDGRPLLAVRLRDLGTGSLRENMLGQTILSHLHIGTKHKLEQEFPRAVFVLDGFDELCMMEGLRDYENMIYQFCRWLPDGCKVLITSRPRYIQAERIKNLSFSLLSLEHFSPEKREEWLNKYISLFPKGIQAVDPEVANYIYSVSDDSVSSICDTPLTLYLLVGSKATFELTRNIWALYHHIFSKAVVDTEYARQMKVENEAHPMGTGTADLLYQITEEIAFKMFCAGGEHRDDEVVKAGEGQFLVTEQGVTSIIKNLLEREAFRVDAEEAGFTNPETRSIALKRSHALCCYWKTSADRGLIEFYHNNIRDFFLCEKIYREINQIYQQQITDLEKINLLSKRLVKLFRHGVLSPMVCECLRERAKFAVADHKETEFPLMEKAHPLLPKLYEYMLLHGTLYDMLEMESHVSAIEFILHATAQMYRYIYEPILEDEAYIHWWENVNEVNRSGMIGYVFWRFVGKIAYQSDFSGAVFYGADLSGANFHKAVLSNADLSETNLRRADLSEANLDGASLSGVNMFGRRMLLNSETNLSKASLRRAVLSEAVLSGASMSGADLTKANLHGACLSDAVLHRANLSGADLSGADLRGTVLRESILVGANLSKARLFGADLFGADLSQADLSQAILPDGFRCETKQEWIDHLKVLNIPGLRF